MRILARFLFLSCVIVLGILLCAGCKQKTSETIPTSQQYMSKKVQAILQPDKYKVKAGEPITLLFSILNGTDAPVVIDGRMAWPGNLQIWVKLPNSQIITVTTIRIKMRQPSKKDMIILLPNRLYGSRINIVPEGQMIAKELREPVPGVYTFWVEYYSSPNAMPGCKLLSLESNRVEIRIGG